VLSSALVTGALFEVLRGLANLWALGLVLAVAATLAWFVYSVFLKRLLRVRRIANIRLRRMLEERKRFEN
jgi:drug/metabolite transporter (DMT)-like permease